MNELKSPRLEFKFYDSKYSQDSLRFGTLIIKTPSTNRRFRATSGIQGYQQKGDCLKVGKGAIPACEFTGLEHYYVDTMALNLAHIKGVQGNFYRITPFSVPVKFENKVSRRSDLGIHFDANVPGSSGCIVLPDRDHWVLFETVMLALSAAKIEKIPLYVL